MMTSFSAEPPVKKATPVKSKPKSKSTSSKKEAKSKGAKPASNDSDAKNLRETCKKLKQKLKGSTKKVDSLERTVEVLNSDIRKLKDELS